MPELKKVYCPECPKVGQKPAFLGCFSGKYEIKCKRCKKIIKGESHEDQKDRIR